MKRASPRKAPGSLRGVARVLTIGAVLAVLAGCASVRVTEITRVDAVAGGPSKILVAVNALAPTPADEAEYFLAAGMLQSSLIDRLAKVGISVEPYVPGAVRPGAGLLRVSIVEAQPGNRVQRFILGFGFGRAKLRATAQFEISGAKTIRPVMTFKTYSDSGCRPGLVLSGGVALATANPVPLAVGGAVNVAAGLRGDLDRSVKETAAAMVSQLADYYAAVGWIWSAEGGTRGGFRLGGGLACVQ